MRADWKNLLTKSRLGLQWTTRGAGEASAMSPGLGVGDLSVPSLTCILRRPRMDMPELVKSGTS